jgi:hypothetical protein
VRRSGYFESVKGDQHSGLIYLEFDEHMLPRVWRCRTGRPSSLILSGSQSWRGHEGERFGGVDYEEATKIDQG